MTWLYLGLIRHAWEKASQAHALHVRFETVTRIIPWAEVSLREQEMIMDQWLPIVRPIRYLVILANGNRFPTAVAVLRHWEKEQRRRRRNHEDSMVRLARAAAHDNQSPVFDAGALRRAGWWPTSDLATQMGYSPAHLTRLAREGRVRARKYQGQWWIERASLMAYIAEKPTHGQRGGRGQRGQRGEQL